MGPPERGGQRQHSAKKDTGRTAVASLAALGPLSPVALEELTITLRLPPGTLIQAAWDLVEDGVLTYGATAHFTRVIPPTDGGTP